MDLSAIPDHVIMKLFANNPSVKLWLLIQKYIYAEKTLVKNLYIFLSPDIVYFTKATDVARTGEGGDYDYCGKIKKTRETRGKTGRKERRKIENARRMIEKGYPVEDICDITGLPREEVEGLR